MSEIESLAEGEAFMDAVDTILGLNMPLRDAEIGRLRQAWLAGRAYGYDQAQADRAAAEEQEAEYRDRYENAAMRARSTFR